MNISEGARIYVTVNKPKMYLDKIVRTNLKNGILVSMLKPKICFYLWWKIYNSAKPVIEKV